MLKVQSRQDNVIYIANNTPQWNPTDNLDRMLDDILEYADYDDVDYDAADELVENLRFNNEFEDSINPDDLDLACDMLAKTLENRCEVIEFMPVVCHLFSLTVATRVGDSMIIHCPVQCSYISFADHPVQIEEYE